jgi:hypothetical protein
MASTIVTKNSSTASAVPLTGDLTQGELAVNVTDKRLFTKDSGGTVVEVGTNPTSMTIKTTLKLSGSTSGYVALQGAAAAGSTTYTLPSADGTSGQALTTNGSGTLSWATIAASAATATALGTVYGKMTASGASPYLTALGYNSGLNATGIDNTFLGFESGKATSSGTDNIGIGHQTLVANTTGNFNTAIGSKALATNTTSSYSTAVGYQAGNANTSGTVDAFGYQALVNNTTGSGNAAFGVFALYSNTTGAYNTAYGREAGYKISTGNNNTAIGWNALYNNTTASENTAVGYQAAFTNSTGTQNLAIGLQALYSNTTASYSTAVGYQALKAATGAQNVAFGRMAAVALTSGSGNTALGTNTLYNTTTSNNNVAVGDSALFTNITGTSNVAVGNGAAYTGTSDNNTIVGYQSAYAATTAAANTMIGMRAGFTGTNNVTTGGNNTFLGYYTQSASAGATYQIVIGNEVASQNSGGYVTIGDYSAKVYCYYRGSATWTQTSDATMKNVIGSDSLGLSFINRLNPVKFTWKDVSDLPADHPRYNAKGGNDTTTVIHGLVAQEVKAALDAEGCSTFNGWDQGPDGIQAISRDMFITPLINAVKELKAELDAAKAEIALLKGN